MPSRYVYADERVELPSIPLPGGSGYRFFLPFLKPLGSGPRPQVVHSHSMFLGGLLARRIARRHGCPFVLTYHTLLDEYVHYAGVFAPLARLLLRRHTLKLIRQADVVTVATGAIAKRLRALGVRTRIDVLPSGIDTTSFDTIASGVDYRRGFEFDAELPIVLCVARLAKEKNCALLLDAFARVDTPAQLVFAGDGPLRASLLRRAARLGIGDRVYAVGMLDRAKLSELYLASTVFVLASKTETQGLVFAEASYVGLPVVAVDTEQGREVLSGTDAIFVSAEAQAMAAGIDRALASPATPEIKAVRRTAARRYDRRTTSQRMLALYRELRSA